MNDLKPCPFCGGKVDYWYDAEFNPVGVNCATCKIAIRMLTLKQERVFGDTMAKIAEGGNRRASNALDR
jgi:hypothetical protein